MLKLLKYLPISLLVVACGMVDMMPSPTKQETPAGTRPNNQPAPIPDVFTLIDIPIHDPLADFTDEYKEECLAKVFLRCPPYTQNTGLRKHGWMFVMGIPLSI